MFWEVSFEREGMSLPKASGNLGRMRAGEWPLDLATWGPLGTLASVVMGRGRDGGHEGMGGGEKGEMRSFAVKEA